MQGSGPVQPRGYQARFIAVARGGGNFIFVAPTNSGKTLVAQEHAAHVLSQDAAAASEGGVCGAHCGAGHPASG